MQIFYSNTHRLHNPPFELFDGGQPMPYLESPERMERILSALKDRDWAEILEPEDFGLDPVLAVHDADYVDFLRTAYQEWTQVKTGYVIGGKRPMMKARKFEQGFRPDRSFEMNMQFHLGHFRNEVFD